MSTAPAEIKCATCSLRVSAVAKPKSFKSRLWRWHTGWCPGWKAYQAYLAENPGAEQSETTVK